MDGGDGMVAMVRGCGKSGLSVTLYEGGRKYTLMPNHAVNANRSQPSCSEHVSQPMLRTPNMVHQPIPASSVIHQQMNTPNVVRHEMTAPNMVHQQMDAPNVIHKPMTAANVIHQPLPAPIIKQTYNQQNQYVRRPQQSVFPQNVDRHNSHHSTMTNTEQDKRDISAQVTDGRYTTVYKMNHCNANPTSPPEQITEFPPQRPNPVPGHGNFQVGGVGSGCEKHEVNKAPKLYHGAMVWSERGAVCSPRPSRHLDPFASSLRKYPSLSPDKSSEIIERLVSYSKNSKQKNNCYCPPNYTSEDNGHRSSRGLRDQMRYDECMRLEQELSAVRDVGFRTQYEYLRGRSPYVREPDVRYIREAKTGNRDMPTKDSQMERKIPKNGSNSNVMSRDSQGTVQKKAVIASKEFSPSRLPISKDNVAVSPSAVANELSTTTLPVQNKNSYSTAVENLNPSISVQTFCTMPDIPITKGKSVGTTLSSIEVSTCSVKNDPRKSKSEENMSCPDIETKLCRWFDSMDKDIDNKIVKTKTVLKLKKNISEWGECLKKGIQHVICYKDDSWYSESDDSYLPITARNDVDNDCGVDSIVESLLAEICNFHDIHVNTFQTETLSQLGSRLQQTVLKCKQNNHQSIKEDLLNALYEIPLNVCQGIKKECLEGLAESLGKIIKTEMKRKEVENAITSQKRPLPQDIFASIKSKTSFPKVNAQSSRLRSKTFVVLPHQLVKTSKYSSTVAKQSQYAIKRMTPDDIKAHLVIYIRQLSAKVYEWFDCIKNEIPHIEEAKLADAVHNLAEDIVDRLKFREFSAIQSITSSDETELDYLKYQIFKWINKYVGEDNITTLQKAPDLLQKIRTVPIPNILQTSKMMQYNMKMLQLNEDSDSSNSITTTANNKSLLEKVSDVLPVFKSSTRLESHGKNVEQTKTYNQLKKCGTFIREPNRNVTKTNQYVNIANMTTEQNSGKRCCSGVPPVSGPESRIDRINDEYFEYLDQWLKRIPIPFSSESDRELADKARMGISNGFLHSLYGLSLDSVKLSNRFYYEDVLEDVLDDLLNELPQIPELVKMKPVLKSQLIEKTMSTYELMYKIRDNVSYQQQFVHTVLAMVPNRRRSVERLSDEMEICSFVDEFILSVRYRNDDPDRSKWHRDKAFQRIENFVEELHNFGKIGNDKTRWTCEIMRALDNVPAPPEEILREEVDRITLEEEIEKWYLSLPVIDNEEVYERIRRKNLKAVLVKKIFDMDREINLGDCTGQRELKYEISRFIQKLPLREDGNLNMNILINTLLTKLKSRSRQKEYEHNSRKSVSFDEVYPPPPCCQQNRQYQSPIGEQFNQNRNSTSRQYINDSINYSQFQQNIPKASSYNEQNNDMKFYSLEETQMPSEMKQKMTNNTGMTATSPDQYKFYSFQGTGPSTKDSQQQIGPNDILGTFRRTSNQGYQVPNQYCRNKRCKSWREGLHTSQNAGPSGVPRINQPQYSSFKTSDVSEYQKSYSSKPSGGLHTSQAPGPSGLSGAQQLPSNSTGFSASPLATYFKPSSPVCCDKPYCFKSRGLDTRRAAPNVVPRAQQFEAAPVTHDPTAAPQTPFKYPKMGGFVPVMGPSGSSVGSLSGSVTPTSMPEDSRIVGVQHCCQTSYNNHPSSSPTATHWQESYQASSQMTSGSTKTKPQCVSCHGPMQTGSSATIQNQISTQIQPPMASHLQQPTSQVQQGAQMQRPMQQPSYTSHMQPQYSTQMPQDSSLQMGSQITSTSTRPNCSPWCSDSQPYQSKKSCLMPGCCNPNCKVPKKKRRKIQQLQTQLRKINASRGILDEGLLNQDCSPNNVTSSSLKCRCMEFYIKKCKKARKCTYPYSDCTAVLDIPPCLAFRSPNTCFF